MKKLHFKQSKSTYRSRTKRTFEGFVDDISDVIPNTASWVPVNRIEGLEDSLYDSWVNEDWDDPKLKALQVETDMSDAEFRERTLDDMGGVAIEVSINEDGSGFINWDNDYDTDYVKSITDCEEWELVEMVKEETRHGFKRYYLEEIWEDLMEMAEDNRYYDLLDEMAVKA